MTNKDYFKPHIQEMYVFIFDDVPLVELYLHACQVRVTVGDSGLVVLV